MNHGLDLNTYARMYATINCQLGTPDEYTIMTSKLVTIILTQYHVLKGLKVFRDEGVQAFLKELRQLHNLMVMEPVDADKMSKAEKKAAFQYLILKKRSTVVRSKEEGVQMAESNDATCPRTKLACRWSQPRY